MKRIPIIFLCIFLLTGCYPQSSLQDVIPIPTAQNTTEIVNEDSTQMLSVSVPVTTNRFYAEDGTELFFKATQHMQLLLPDETVASRIILDFLNRVDTMQHAAEDLLLAAQSIYNPDSYWTPYHQQVIYSPTRIDWGVLSLSGINSSYSGGVHSSQRAVSVSYDLATGDVLTLASIMHIDAQKEDFIELILDDLRKNAEVYYLFDDYEQTVRNLLAGDEAQYQDFYFTPTSLVFYFSPYEIAPYVSGIINVEIPYSKLTGLLYNGYFPDEKDEGVGSIQYNDLTNTNIDQFSQIEEIILDSSKNLIVIYPQGNVSDVQIIVPGDGMSTPSYTVFAAYEMDEHSAVILGADSTKQPGLTIQYSSNALVKEFIL